MQLYAVATHREGWYDALVASARRGGYVLRTLGWGQRWRSFVWRFDLLLAALADVPDDEVVGVVDAFDVVLLVPAAEMVARFRALVPDGRRVVLSVNNPLRHWVADVYTAATFGTCPAWGGRVLNMGGLLGCAGPMRAFLRLVRQHAARHGLTDDQKALNGACAELGRRDLLRIDEQGDIFFHATCRDTMAYARGVCDLGLTADLRNPLTGRRPAVLHAPGGVDLNPACRRLRLPRGRRHVRWRWYLGNFWREAVVVLLVLAALVGVAVHAWGRRWRRRG